MAPNRVLQVMFGPFRAPPATEPKHWASLSSSHCETSLNWGHGGHARRANAPSSVDLLKCSNCGAPISFDTATCPSCGFMFGGSNGALHQMKTVSTSRH